jgi:hypothetical protein
MKVYLQELENGEQIEAIISTASKKDMPLKKDGWQFTWKKLARTEGSDFFKLTRLDAPDEIEGILMLTLLYEEMPFMNNIEVAPHNYGSGGKFENVAGNLIAFACYKSFEIGKNSYVGFLSFESKTKLIDLYQDKYGADFAMGNKMFFDPIAGKNLMKKYLMIDFKESNNEEE